MSSVEKFPEDPQTEESRAGRTMDDFEASSMDSVELSSPTRFAVIAVETVDCWKGFHPIRLSHRIVCASTATSLCWNFVRTCYTWFAYDNRRASAYGGTDLKTACKPWSRPRTGTASPTNECAYAAWDPMTSQMFFRIQGKRDCEHRRDVFWCVAVDSMDR